MVRVGPRVTLTLAITMIAAPGLSVERLGSVAETKEARASEVFGRLPITFEPNRGQVDRHVNFVSRGGGYSLFLTSNGAVLALSQRSVKGTLPSGTDVLRVQLAGAKALLKASGMDELTGKANYFIGSDPSKWRTNVPTFAKVKYSEVYPGVDLIYYGSQKLLEFDFVIAPGADSKMIRLRLRGAAKFKIDDRGALVLQMKNGEVQFERPHVYQEIEGRKKKIIEGRYTLDGNGLVGFEVANYDRTIPLVIDPVLLYSTYLGGSGDDRGNGIAVDSAGNMYVTGDTTSTNFPTLNALQTSFNGGNYDAFITKINASGSALIYSTYLGGGGFDTGSGIAVDSAGNAYVTGLTGSTNFPTLNALQPALSNTFSAFVAKISASGSSLTYSTYLGGGAYYRGTGIAADSVGNAYVTGQQQNSASAFVLRINPTGSAMLYATNLQGSSGINYGSGIAVDTAGNAYVTGATGSTDFPTANPLQPVLGGGISGVTDAFVAKIVPVDLSPRSVTFAGQPVGTTSTAQAVTLTNAGNVAMTIPNLIFNGTNASDFIETDNCIGSVAVGASCTINMTFAPSATGSRTATLIISNSLAGAPLSVPLNGTGVSPTQIATLSPGSLAFGSQLVGTTSMAQTVTLTDGGSVAMTISKLTISGANASDFAETDNCVGTVAAGASCSINAKFAPSNSGSRTGTLSISDTATGSPQMVNLVGTGIAPVASISPSNVSFPAQYVGTSGLPQSVTVTNSGTAALSFTSVAASPNDFAVLDNCANSLAPGTACVVGVFFNPAQSGTRNGTLTITDIAPGSPQTIPLTGAGQDFSLAPMGSSSSTVAAGQTASFTVAVTPGGGFNQTVTLSCAGVPVLSSCSAPGSIVLNGSSASSITVSVTTTAASGQVRLPPLIRTPDGREYTLVNEFLLLLAAMVFLSLTFRKELSLSRVLLITVIFCNGLTLYACGGGGGSVRNPGTPTGTYTLTLTGSFKSGSTNLSHTTNLTMVVQ